MKPWIKAGLVGAVLEIVFTLPSLLMFVAPNAIGFMAICCASTVFFLILPAVGVLTGVWLQKPATTKTVILQSALAGLLSSTIDGIFTVALMAAVSISGLMTAFLGRLAPSALPQIQRNELLRFYFSLPGLVISTSLCAIGNILIAVGLSVVGALVYAAITKKAEAS